MPEEAGPWVSTKVVDSTRFSLIVFRLCNLSGPNCRKMVSPIPSFLRRVYLGTSTHDMIRPRAKNYDASRRIFDARRRRIFCISVDKIDPNLLSIFHQTYDIDPIQSLIVSPIGWTQCTWIRIKFIY